MQYMPRSHLHGALPFERSHPERNNVLGACARRPTPSRSTIEAACPLAIVLSSMLA